jgi:hypothetical protein
VIRERRLGLVLLAPLIAALVFSYVRLIAALDDVPADDDYVQARAILERQGFQRGDDALVILPPWSLRPLTVVGDLDPISGDALAEQPLHRYARLFALVEPGAEPMLASLRARRGAPAAVERAGRVRIERYDLPGPRAGYDFRAKIEDAEVRVDGALCDRRVRGGFACDPREAWQRVTREWLLVSENADLAVWSHPPSRGKKLQIAWRAVPMGSQIVIRAGHTRDGAARARAPVRLAVWVDGERVDVVVRKPRFSFDTDIIDTHRFAGRIADVTFEIDTDDNSGNQFAWDAYVVAP